MAEPKFLGSPLQNKAGAWLSAGGYVLCMVCGKENQGISRETGPDFALCINHSRQQQEVCIMGAVPKPSQVKKVAAEKRSHHKKAKPMKEAKVAKPTAAAKASNGHDKVAGHFAQITELAKAAGGWTGEQIREECATRGLSLKTAGNYVCYIKRAGFVRP
jgi:hypothetical protein